MSAIEQYKKVFQEVLGVKENELSKLSYQKVSQWDSIGHMNLISAIEDSFDIMMETDDIIDFSSYEKGIEILKDKYGVQF